MKPGCAATFVSSLTGSANQVLIGASVSATLANLAGAITASSTGGQGAGTTYGTGTVINPVVTVKTTSSTAVTVKTFVAGVLSPTTTTGTSHLTWGATTTLAGIRDTTVTKTPAGYLFTYAISYPTGPFYESGHGCFSKDLINWTEVTAAGSDIVASLHGHTFTDVDGKIYTLRSNPGLNEIQSPYDGSVIGSTIPITLVGGSAITSGRDGSAIIYIGGTYHLYWSHSDGTVHHATSTSLASGYTDLGSILSGQSMEGMSAYTKTTGSSTSYVLYGWSQSGTYTTQMCYSTSSDGTAWTDFQPLNTTPTSDSSGSTGIGRYWWDNACGFSFTDLKTMHDADSAMDNQGLGFVGGRLGSSLGAYIGVGVGSRSNATNISYSPLFRNLLVGGIATSTPLTGTGTLSISGTSVTGTGTLFATEITPGYIIHPSGGADLHIASVASSTAMTTYETSSSTSTSFTYMPFTMVATAGDVLHNQGLIVDGYGNSIGQGSLNIFGGIMSISSNSSAPFIVSTTTTSGTAGSFFMPNIAASGGAANIYVGRSVSSSYESASLTFNSTASGSSSNQWAIRLNGSGTTGMYGNGLGQVSINTPTPNGSNNLTVGGSGYFSGSLSANGVLLQDVMTANTTSTIIFNTSGNPETIYNTSASTLATATITLPTTTKAGQVLRYATHGIITSLTISGTVDIGAGATAMTADQAPLIYQSTGTNGHFVRLQ